MKYHFHRNKYKTELLIDCFEKSDNLAIEGPTRPFITTFFEVIFITKGSGSFQLDDEHIPFSEGTVMLMPPHKWRQWTEINQPFDATFLIFEEEFISAFFQDALFLYRFQYFFNAGLPSYVNIPPELLPELQRMFREVKRELKSLKPDSNHLLRALLYYLLIKINRQYQAQHTIEKDFYEEPLVLRFRKLLEQHIRQKQRVSEYTAMLNVSSTHLNKLLKSYFGKSCSELIRERLLVEIKQQLLFTDKQVAEIGYELGFSEPANFNRFFKEMTQLTPRAYRQQFAK